MTKTKIIFRMLRYNILRIQKQIVKTLDCENFGVCNECPLKPFLTCELKEFYEDSQNLYKKLSILKNKKRMNVAYSKTVRSLQKGEPDGNQKN